MKRSTSTPRSEISQPVSKRTLVAAACRSDFLSFKRKCFNTVAPGALFLPNWHLEAMAYHLELARLGVIKRLIINLPPRYLKSIAASVAFPAFVLGHDPSKQIIVASYGSDLAVKLSNDFRAVVQADWYRRTFPRMEISPTKNTEFEVGSAERGFRLATSIDGALTGRGGDFIIVDDPLKPSDALSEARRERVNEWFFNTLLSRLNDKQRGVVIVVMQRLHGDDLTGALSRSSEEWTVLSLPAIAELEQSIQIGPKMFYARQVGEVLHPAREPKWVLDALRSQLGLDTFSAQYQQRPVPPGGAMIKLDWVRRFVYPPTLETPSRILQSWDTAQKEGRYNDYSVCTTWLWSEKKWYLTDLVRGRFDYPTLKARAKDHAGAHKPEKILIEDAGVGSALVAELRSMGLPAVAVKPEHDKITRMSIQSGKFESGLVHFPQEASWLSDLEAELFAFPNGSHDDQVDSISQALAHEFPGCEWTDEALQGLQRLTFHLSLPYF
jgi:predicted phage terminase large subunit-like protein